MTRPEASWTTPPPAAERALARLREGEDIPRGAPSRFGVIGRLARRIVLRLIRPYSMRQRELDKAIVEALLARELSPPRVPRVPWSRLDPTKAFEAETVAGPMWLPRDDDLLAPVLGEHGMWEPHVTGFLQRALRPGGVFADVGANIGYFSLLASRLVGGAGQVIAVEPDPANLAFLEANLWRNGCDSAWVLPLAAWDERGQLSLMTKREGGAATWVTANASDAEAHGDTRAALVPCATLDQLLGDQRIDVLKVDCELVDHVVVRGAEGIIDRNPDLVIVAEFFPKFVGQSRESPKQILESYERLGLEIRLLTSEGELEQISKEQLLEMGTDPRAPVELVLRRPAA